MRLALVFVLFLWPFDVSTPTPVPTSNSPGNVRWGVAPPSTPPMATIPWTPTPNPSATPKAQ